MGLLGEETLGDPVVIPTQERFEVRSINLHRTLSLAMSVRPRVGVTAPVDVRVVHTGWCRLSVV